MYVALFVIMDLLILCLLLIAVFFLLNKLRELRERENEPIENDLDSFRNDTLMEETDENLKRLAHIEEVAACRASPDAGESAGKERDE